MKKLLSVLILLLAVGAVVYVAIIARRTTPTSTGQLAVAASFYPLAEFAQQIGGDNVSVATITPPGSEPHDFEPSPQDLVAIYNAKVFVFNGSGLDAWAEKIAPDLLQKGIVVVKTTEQLSDPHTWLDPVLAQREVNLVRDALKQVDSARAADYNQRAEAYVQQLVALDQLYREGLAHCTLHDVVASHAALSYLAKRYGLTVTSIAGLDPEAEPSAQKLGEIADLVRTKHIAYIFFETLVDPKLAQTIANETGAKTLVFNPIEGLTAKELAAGKTYLSIMQDNLVNLKLALQCR